MKSPARCVRVALAAALLAGLALSSAACAKEEPPPVSVLGPWTGDEEESFEKVLALFESEYDIKVDYEGTISRRETLLAQVQADSPPDIAILPSLGELAEYAHEGELVPLPEAVRERSPAPWSPELAVDDRTHTYWTPVKIDLKSVVWHYPQRPATKGDWCLGMGSDATSGWPGSDWIEDILLQQAGPGVYEDWATGALSWQHEDVRTAWETWGRIVTAGGRSQAREALANDFEAEDGRGLLKPPPAAGCTREHQGSFIRRLYGSKVRFAATADAVPELANDNRAFEVSGDMAAMFRDSPEARKLLTFLTGKAARTAWVAGVKERNRPFFPVSAGTYGEAWGNRSVDRALRGATRLCVDASDAMPPNLVEAFHRAVLEYLDYLGSPKGRKSPLDSLLEQLELERGRQHKSGAPYVPSVCGTP
ncbi:MAG TPA: extracellular solute-binding protein [Streptomyces sp.]|nr:extracellular solute-binding protein [Streptomyces sp.]